MIVEVLQPAPQTINLGDGAKTVTINYHGVVRDASKNKIGLMLEVIGNATVVFFDDQSSTSWQQEMTTTDTDFQHSVTFKLAGTTNKTGLCALELTATDPDGIQMHTSTHIDLQ